MNPTRRTHLIAVRVTPEKKAAFAAVAAQAGLSESALMDRVLDVVLERNTTRALPVRHDRDLDDGRERITLRLSTVDLRRLEAQAVAVQLPVARHCTLVLRAHATRAALCPPTTLASMKAAVAALTVLATALRERPDMVAVDARAVLTEVQDLKSSMADFVRDQLIHQERRDV